LLLVKPYLASLFIAILKSSLFLPLLVITLWITLGESIILRLVTSNHNLWLIFNQVILMNDPWAYIELMEPNPNPRKGSWKVPQWSSLILYSTWVHSQYLLNKNLIVPIHTQMWLMNIILKSFLIHMISLSVNTRLKI
jgi:hypothetical protein